MNMAAIMKRSGRDRQRVPTSQEPYLGFPSNIKLGMAASRGLGNAKEKK
jgi:hypothetical protein